MKTSARPPRMSADMVANLVRDFNMGFMSENTGSLFPDIDTMSVDMVENVRLQRENVSLTLSNVRLTFPNVSLTFPNANTMSG